MRIGVWRRKRCAEPLCRRGLPCGSPRALPCGSPCALPRGFPRGICPCVAPLPLRQCMRRGAFSCGRGDCPAGACPPPCRLTAPLWCPQGGLSGWSAADRAVPEAARGGACFFSRLPILPLAFFTAPLPRRGRIDPRPRSQSALPLRGRGRDYSFLMQGAAPLASPGLNPGGTYSPNKKGTRRGACLLCRLPTMPLVYFLSPIPPTPFPSGEGGDHKFISPGASPPAPRH